MRILNAAFPEKTARDNRKENGSICTTAAPVLFLPLFAAERHYTCRSLRVQIETPAYCYQLLVVEVVEDVDVVALVLELVPVASVEVPVLVEAVLVLLSEAEELSEESLSLPVASEAVEDLVEAVLVEDLVLLELLLDALEVVEVPELVLLELLLLEQPVARAAIMTIAISNAGIRFFIVNTPLKYFSVKAVL
ncbi:MAG: hypothetical protein H6Q60_713 [Oscillospiraceae bacterium]|nr:hypothetical protein [Oscillospiraceae bacterium]